jgi:hypothetical protein
LAPGGSLFLDLRWNDAMLQRADTSRLRAYIATKRAFDRRRRALRLNFDTLYGFFSSAESGARIARRANVSKERINFVYNKYFSDFFGMTARERQRHIERKLREEAGQRLADATQKDRVLAAIRKSAERAGTRRRIEPVLRRKCEFVQFRHKAVLVDGTKVESVHHIRTRRFSRRGTIAYGSTTLSRTTLESLKRTIFVIDVPRYPRRVIRCRSDKLLKRLFSAGQQRVSVYIPLEQSLENPRYDFLADENNWA